MTSELRKGKAMWMRSFYGFSPEEDGYVGVGREAARDRMLREMNDGDLVLIYGSGTVETKKAERSCVLGFLQVDARAIRDVDKSSPEALKRKTDKGWEERWTYGIPVRRAWRAVELRTIRDIAFKTYRPEAGQALGVWGAAMEPDEIAEALKIRVTEVNVYGEPPVSDGLVGDAFEQVFTPSRAFQGSAGSRSSVYEDGETFLYLAVFEGDGPVLTGRRKVIGKAFAAMKIGVSNDTDVRCAQLNLGFPPAALGKWAIRMRASFPDRKSAEDAERMFKENR